MCNKIIFMQYNLFVSTGMRIFLMQLSTWTFKLTQNSTCSGIHGLLFQIQVSQVFPIPNQVLSYDTRWQILIQHILFKVTDHAMV